MSVNLLHEVWSGLGLGERWVGRPAFLVALVLALCPGADQSAADLVGVRVGASTFRVELAQTDEERNRGLMFRRTLAADQGMLFSQPPGRAEFWMKNTLIPLDLLFFGADGTLLQVLPEVQPCRQAQCPTYLSESAAVSHILEIKGGEARRRSIRVGDLLEYWPMP